MTEIPIIGQETKEDRIDRMTTNVISLLETVPLSSDELLGIIELSLLDTVSNLAGYMHEMQRQILRGLGIPAEIGEATAEEFAASYIEDYTLLRMARTESLLLARQEEMSGDESDQGDDGG
jgi:hypothetical protein